MKAIVNIGLKKGVLDSGGKATYHTLQTIGYGDLVSDVRVGKQIIIELTIEDEDRAREAVDKMCKDLLANTVIEDYEIILEA